MKTKTVQYSIQEPCDASWNNMTPEPNGRFCGSCDKSVVDFTQMSDFSIVSYLENHKQEKVCGRFTKPQLDRVYNLNQPVFTPTFDLRAVVLGLAMTTFSAVHSFSQMDSIPPITLDSTFQRFPLVMGWVAPSYSHKKEKTVSGKILNAISDFKLVTVKLINEEGKILKTIHPDEKGCFKFDLYWNLRPASMEISGVGYESRVIYFSNLKSLKDVRVHLLDQVETIRGEIIQGDVYEVQPPAEDEILQKIEIGNVNIEKEEK